MTTRGRRCSAGAAPLRTQYPWRHPSPGRGGPGCDPLDAEGQSATPTFSVLPPDLGCTITPGGVLTPGTTAGTVTIRAGNIANFDETKVTLTPPPNPNPNPTPPPGP